MSHHQKERAQRDIRDNAPGAMIIEGRERLVGSLRLLEGAPH
jgi:hypothetical protein